MVVMLRWRRRSPMRRLDTGGAGSSQGPSTALLPSPQAQGVMGASRVGGPHALSTSPPAMLR